jgi:hypothetical protein
MWVCEWVMGKAEKLKNGDGAITRRRGNGTGAVREKAEILKC